MRNTTKKMIDVLDCFDLCKDELISVDRIGGFWRVLWCGKVIRTFTCVDAHTKATGYALAMLDGRDLQTR